MASRSRSDRSAGDTPQDKRKPQFFGEGLPYVPSTPWPGSLIVVEGTDGTGRSTQIVSLVDWLETQGFAVVETGWLRSKLVGEAVNNAKKGHTLTRMTYTLLYATDFADRLEYEIVPALRSGSIVLADRYIFTCIARAIVRGVHPQWARDLFGFAPRPDLVFYLSMSVDQLIPRVLRAGKMNYWESGMDLNLGEDLYDSFRIYQQALLEQFDVMRSAYDFISLDATAPAAEIQASLRQRIGSFLQERYGRALDPTLIDGAEDPLNMSYQTGLRLPTPTDSKPLLPGPTKKKKGKRP